MSVREELVYAYDNAVAGQRERLRTLEALFDAGTVAELEARGIDRGWRCLEVGAGGGSIALWLADRVAPEGIVAATDRDTTLLDELSHPNLEVRVHDVLEDDLPEREFDVVCLGRASMWRGGQPGGEIWRLSLMQLREGIIASGLMEAEEADAAIELCADPRLSTLSPVMMTAWGRRPS